MLTKIDNCLKRPIVAIIIVPLLIGLITAIIQTWPDIVELFNSDNQKADQESNPDAKQTSSSQQIDININPIENPTPPTSTELQSPTTFPSPTFSILPTSTFSATPSNTIIASKTHTPTPPPQIPSPTNRIIPTNSNLSNLCTRSTSISYGGSTTGTIDNTIYVIGYCFMGTEGDDIVITMETTSGTLDPYLELSDFTGNTLYASNDDANTSTRNSTIVFRLVASGQYLIVASRYAIDNGDSSGNFRLTLQANGNANQVGQSSQNSSSANDTSEVNISCDTGEQIVGGVQLSFINVNPGDTYTVTAVGLEGFDPVVAVETESGVGTCNDDAVSVAGSEIAVPDFGLIVSNSKAAQVRFSSPQRGNPTNISVGSDSGEMGQYVLIIEGLEISPSDELDGFAVSVPNNVAMETFSVYMVSKYADLDAYLELYQGDGLTQAYDEDGNFYEDSVDYNNIEFLFACDDAGIGDCADTPAFPGGGVDIANGSRYVASDRDAGLLVTPNSSLPMLFVFGSVNGTSAGEYAIMVIGHVPGN